MKSRCFMLILLIWMVVECENVLLCVCVSVCVVEYCCDCLGVRDKWGLSTSSSASQVFLLSDRVLCIESYTFSLAVGILEHCWHQAAARHWRHVDWAKGHFKTHHSSLSRGDNTCVATTATYLGQYPCQWLWLEAVVSGAIWRQVTKIGTLRPRCSDEPQLWIWVGLHCTAHSGTVEPC